MAILPVKWYSSDMEGAPTISDSWGQLTNMLDKVLIDGFTARTASTITRSGSIVTVTFAASHKFKNDSVIEISGATQTDYNGQWRVQNASVLAFDFDIGVLTPVTPATGTISVKVPALGWERLFTDTVGTSTDQGGRRIYRSLSSLSNKNCLRVEDFRPPNDFPPTTFTNYTTTYAKHARVGMAQNFTNSTTPVGAQAPYDVTNPNRNWITTGTGTSVVSGWYKWYWMRYPWNTGAFETSQDTSIKSWYVFGDDRGFYIFQSTWGASPTNSFGWAVYSFTDFQSYKANDPYNTILTAADWTSNVSAAAGVEAGSYFTRSLEWSGKVLLRNWTGNGNYVRAGFYSLSATNGITYPGYSTGLNNYNLPDYSQPIFPTYIRYEVGGTIGKMPGVYWPLTVGEETLFYDGQVMENVVSYSGRKFMNMNTNINNSGSYSMGRIWMDITGPWR